MFYCFVFSCCSAGSGGKKVRADREAKHGGRRHRPRNHPVRRSNVGFVYVLFYQGIFTEPLITTMVVSFNFFQVMTKLCSCQKVGEGG